MGWFRVGDDYYNLLRNFFKGSLANFIEKISIIQNFVKKT